MHHPRDVAVVVDLYAGHDAFGEERLGVLAFDEQRLSQIDRAAVRIAAIIS